jgi:hypothetical protein
MSLFSDAAAMYVQTDIFPEQAIVPGFCFPKNLFSINRISQDVKEEENNEMVCQKNGHHRNARRCRLRPYVAGVLRAADAGLLQGRLQ